MNDTYYGSNSESGAWILRVLEMATDINPVVLTLYKYKPLSKLQHSSKVDFVWLIGVN